LLILVYHPGKIVIRDKVNVYPAVSPGVYVNIFKELHLIVVHRKIIVVAVIFKDEKIAPYLSDDIEIGTPVVVPFRLRIIYSLCRNRKKKGKCGKYVN
jgi:hypothetical protein